METDTSDISSAAPNLRVESRFARSGKKRIIYLIGAEPMLIPYQNMIRCHHPPAAFPIHLLLLPKKKSTLLSGKSSRTYAKTIYFQVDCTAVGKLCSAFFFCMCVFYASFYVRTSLDVHRGAFKMSFVAILNMTRRLSGSSARSECQLMTKDTCGS